MPKHLQSQFTVAQLIERLFDGLSPELQTAARWLLLHQAEAAVVSMRRCALLAGVSAPTMTRLAKALGMDGFKDIQRQLSAATLALAKHKVFTSRQPAHAYAENARDALDHERLQARNSSGSTWLQRLAASHVGNAASGSAALAQDKWYALGLRLLASEHMVCLGMRASFSVAQQLYYASSLLRPNVHLMFASAGQTDVLCGMDARSTLVVVSQAPYTQQVLLAATRAKQQGLHVVAVTDSSISPLTSVADEVVLFEAQAASFFPSMLGSLSAAETLLAAMAVQAQPEHLAHLATREQYLRDSQAYVLASRDSADFLQLTPLDKSAQTSP